MHGIMVPVTPADWRLCFREATKVVPMLNRHVQLFLLAGVAVVCLLAWRGCRDNGWRMTNAESATGAVACFGDSLVAGVGAETPEMAYPAQLEKLLGKPVRANGIPGNTTADGLAWLQANQDAFAGKGLVIVTLGGNDLMQRRAWTDTARDLRAIFAELQRRGAFVVYTGVAVPLFANHTAEQRSVCQESGVYFIPNLLGGIIADRALKADEVHPNGLGYAIVADRIAKALRQVQR